MLVTVLVVPMSHTFSFSMTPGLAFVGWQSEEYPPGARVNFSWETQHGLPMGFLLVGPGGNTLYSAVYPNQTSQGSFTFTSMGGTYTYECEGAGSQLITVSGIASYPIL